MGQVIESGRKVGVANKTAGCGAGKVGDGNCAMVSVRSIDKGEDKGMAQARRKEGAFRAPITGIFVEQNGSGETSDAFSSSPGETVSVVASKCLCSSAPFMRVVLRRICHACPGAEGVRDEAARAKRGLH